MNIIDFVQNGGVIVYILIAINIIGFTLIISKIINIFQINKNIDLISNEISQEITSNINKSNFIDNIIAQKISHYEFGLNTIRTIATISPLLGLLGTVVGILLSFDTISKVGLEDPTLFSASISLALITTVAGLIVSIPHYIFYNFYIGVLEKAHLKIHTKVMSTL